MELSNQHVAATTPSNVAFLPMVAMLRTTFPAPPGMSIDR
jgi:hypothetical protein